MEKNLPCLWLGRQHCAVLGKNSITQLLLEWLDVFFGGLLSDRKSILAKLLLLKHFSVDNGFDLMLTC